MKSLHSTLQEEKFVLAIKIGRLEAGRVPYKENELIVHFDNGQEAATYIEEHNLLDCYVLYVYPSLSYKGIENNFPLHRGTHPRFEIDWETSKKKLRHL